MPEIRRRIVFRNIVTAGFALFMGGAFLTRGFFPLDIQDSGADSLLNWCIFATLRDAGAILMTAGIIIPGLRSIRMEGSSRRRVVMVLCGIGIGLVFLTLNSVAAVQMDKMLQSYDFSRMIGLIESKLQQENLPAEKRYVLLQKLAESRYLQSGERILVPAEDGAQTVYDPPETTVAFRANVDFARRMYGMIRQWSSRAIYVWIGVLAFSTVVGAVSSEN